MAWMVTGLAGLAALLVFAIGRWGIGARPHAPTATTYATYTTRSGQVLHLALADGSRLTLAPNSRAEVARDFANMREVKLTGEAYFEVVPLRHAPFLVHTGLVTTRVLGTAFDIRHDVADATTRVVVVNGKVAAGPPGRSSVTLVAGAVGTFVDSTVTVTVVNDVTSLTDWKSGRLRFNETPLPEVLTQVSRWYGVDFQLADSTLTHEKVTAALDYGELSDVVRALEHLLDVSATTDGSKTDRPVVVLRPHRSTSRRTPAPTRWDMHELTQTEVGR